MSDEEQVFVCWACEGPGGREFEGLILARDLEEAIESIGWAMVFTIESLTGPRVIAMT